MTEFTWAQLTQREAAVGRPGLEACSGAREQHNRVTLVGGCSKNAVLVPLCQQGLLVRA